MTKPEKPCEHCKKIFQLPRCVSRKNWAVRKYCSAKCRCLSMRGKPSWNAGKCPPFKVTQAYREKMRKIALKTGYGKWMQGRKLSEETRKKMIGLQSGAKHPMWKGGHVLGSDGYTFTFSPDHPFRDSRNKVRDHRLIAEKSLGRYLKPEEIIHHINEIKTDNRLENLYLFPNDKEHRAYHQNKNRQVLVSNLPA